MENETIEQKFVRIRKIFAAEMRKIYNCDIEEDDLTNSQLACSSLMIDIACKEILNITNNEIQKLRNQREYQFDRVDKHYEEINKELVEKVEKLNKDIKAGTEDYTALVKKNKEDISNFDNETLAKLSIINTMIVLIIGSLLFCLGFIVGGGSLKTISQYASCIIFIFSGIYCFYYTWKDNSFITGLFGILGLILAILAPLFIGKYF